MKHSFTPAEANRTLPLVRRIVDDILEAGRELKSIADGEPSPAAQERFRELQYQIREWTQELERVGCSYKDWGFDLGLVDFPSEIDGEPVLLCWRSDEESVTWFHRPEAGYAGRTPIPDELLSES